MDQGGPKPLRVRWNAQGQLQSEAIEPDLAAGIAHAVTATDDGYLIAGLDVAKGAFVARRTVAGAPVWLTNLGPPEVTAVTALGHAPGGGAVVVLSLPKSIPGATWLAAVVLRTDAAGKVLWMWNPASGFAKTGYVALALGDATHVAGASGSGFLYGMSAFLQQFDAQGVGGTTYGSWQGGHITSLSLHKNAWVAGVRHHGKAASDAKAGIQHLDLMGKSTKMLTVPGVPTGPRVFVIPRTVGYDVAYRGLAHPYAQNAWQVLRTDAEGKPSCP